MNHKIIEQFNLFLFINHQLIGYYIYPNWLGGCGGIYG